MERRSHRASCFWTLEFFRDDGLVATWAMGASRADRTRLDATRVVVTRLLYNLMLGGDKQRGVAPWGVVGNMGGLGHLKIDQLLGSPGRPKTLVTRDLLFSETMVAERGSSCLGLKKYVGG